MNSKKILTIFRGFKRKIYLQEARHSNTQFTRNFKIQKQNLPGFKIKYTGESFEIVSALIVVVLQGVG